MERRSLIQATGMAFAALVRQAMGTAAAALVLACVIPALVPEHCHAEAIDTLICRVEGDEVLLGLHLKADALVGEDVQSALDRQLRVECVISLSVNQRGFLGASTVVAHRVKRSITYSRMRREFSITEGGREIYYDDSFFRTIESFLAFDEIPVLNASHLDTGKEHYIQVSVEVRFTVPPESSGRATALDSTMDTLRAISRLVESDEPLVAEERRSCPFKPEAISPTLFRDVCGVDSIHDAPSQYACASPY